MKKTSDTTCTRGRCTRVWKASGMGEGMEPRQVFDTESTPFDPKLKTDDTVTTKLHFSKVSLIDPKDDTPTTIRWEERDGFRVRIAESGEVVPKGQKKEEPVLKILETLFLFMSKMLTKSGSVTKMTTS